MNENNSNTGFCACGCGGEVMPGRKYIHGHNQKGKPSSRKVQPIGDPPFCACGCGVHVLWSTSRRRWNKYIKGHERRGRTHSTEAIAIMKEKAQLRAESVAENNRARIWTDESRLKLSEAKRKNPPVHQFKQGEDNPLYKHGNEYRRPSASILLRHREALIAERGFRCEECGTTPQRNNLLHMHHIDDDPFNNQSNNLQLLCAKCHNTITHAI